jgi:transposase
MERLEKKKINGKEYYYYSKWGWKDGKCRRLWQKYLGKLEDIAKAVEGGDAPAYAEVFDFGLSKALWDKNEELDIKTKIDKLCPKRNEKLSVGDYISIAAINRAMKSTSKSGIWEWLSQTALLREFPGIKKQQLCSQRFWDHMDAISIDATREIWENIIADVIIKRNIDISKISYDGTNFYTFINTFNVRNTLGKRGKNKQGRSNLRQISYALFCTKDGIPLFYDVYEGNRNDAKVFPEQLEKFKNFMKNKFNNEEIGPSSVTLIFDKGNNSKDNFNKLEESGMNFVGSLKLCEHKDLAEISNSDPCFKPLNREGMEDIKAFAVDKCVYGVNRRLVVMYNKKLFNDQWKTVNTDISKAMDKLSDIKQKLDDRNNGLIKGGKAPTQTSISSHVNSALSRPFIKGIIKVDIQKGPKAPVIEFELLPKQLEEIADTLLGKKIIISKGSNSSITDIIETYHSQYVIEHVFKEMKDRNSGTWWPLFHWTDQKIYVHGLYCTIAVLLRSILHLQVKNAGVNISLQRMLKELSGVKEVINVFSKSGKKKKEKRQTTFTKLNPVQEQLCALLFDQQNIP